MRIILLLVAVVGATLVVGCGDGEEEGEPAAATPAGGDAAGSDLSPADLVARLPEVIITADDIPDGFVQSQSGAVPNEVVAAGDPLPEQRLQELEETGRVGGHQAVFQKGEEAVISAVLSVYETAEGAQESLDRGVRFGPQGAATPVDAPDVGLPGAAWEIEEQAGSSLKGYLMVARKGRVNLSMSFGDVGGVESRDVEDLLRAQIARLGDLE